MVASFLSLIYKKILFIPGANETDNLSVDGEGEVGSIPIDGRLKILPVPALFLIKQL